MPKGENCVSRSSSKRQPDIELGSLIRRGMDDDLAPVTLDDLLDYGQAQPGPRGFGGEKRVEYPLSEFFRNSRAIILD